MDNLSNWQGTRFVEKSEVFDFIGFRKKFVLAASTGIIIA
jgi:hypothetical protein